MNILVKFPSRSRGPRFLEVLARYVETIEEPARVHFLISYDHDDETMTPWVIERAREITGDGNITLIQGVSYDKIHACNRDLGEYKGDWDIVILASDDMIPQVNGWDVFIRQKMAQHFPDTDGCLWFYDGKQNRICTFTMMGRAYYGRFGYLYHPSYKSLFCDNEFTDVARGTGRIIYNATVLFRNESPDWGGSIPRDALYERNNKYWALDERNYKDRQRKRFPA